jgi:hypothetical protein
MHEVVGIRGCCKLQHRAARKIKRVLYHAKQLLYCRRASLQLTFSPVAYTFSTLMSSLAHLLGGSENPAIPRALTAKKSSWKEARLFLYRFTENWQELHSQRVDGPVDCVRTKPS